MERKTDRKTIQVEEHVVTVTKSDLVEALLIEFRDEEEIAVKPDEVRVCVGLGQDKILGPSQLMEILRKQIENLPENAEVVLAIRWREEVEAPDYPPARVGRPGYHQPQPQPQPYYPPQPQPYYPPPQPYYPPPQAPPQHQGGPTCTTCGGQPDLQGPTPECGDPMGCGRVRVQRGEMPVGRAIPPPGVGNVGAGILRGSGQKLFNRETGEEAFADQHGAPYGKFDYDAR